NWGYWGSVGIVASQELQARFARAGLASIEPPEAMAALESLLAGPLHQVGLVITTGRAAASAVLGVRHDERLALYTADRGSHIACALPERHTGSAEPQVLDRITAVLLQATSELLHVQSADLDVHADLHDYGFDLVSLTGLVDCLNRDYHLDEVAR